METLVKVTEHHKCDGHGKLEIKKVYGYGTLPINLARIGLVDVRGKELDLDDMDVDLQHFDSGRTRPVCEFLGSDNKCTRITRETNDRCDRVFDYYLGGLHSEIMSKEGAHCTFVVLPPSPVAGSTSEQEGK
ncbi:MAG: hypothetical protein UT33_C0005G0087 [Candidatus Peregrinibacteria bacterium GW2011_GWC2_39_14]|nr:MAG: hypothetical protein US92_C0001G0087 [Candidatus Peregrinibacteria bacterium GW2011_GWA2_38_36]KKR07143.1 MAG: hypothetical protein UT33_C0005G0087 [Candidatus Peregrinibacteria bacterium GW2011_GWC2_39_14]